MATGSLRLVDSHCHLDFDAFASDREAVVQAGREAGLVAIINPGTSLETSRVAVALAKQYPAVYAAVGVHPHDADSFTQATVAALRDLAGHPKVVAVGEIGLDYYRNYSTHQAQRRAFAAQLTLAADLGLPVIIHNRDATEETFAVLDEWAADGPRRGVLHSYSAGPAWLAQALELGFFVGVSGPVTFPGATGLQQVAQQAPLDRLLVETDAPFLTPVPHRGRRNQPAYVHYVAEKVAELRQIRPSQVAERTTRNCVELFSLDGEHL